jgi:orotate phosphoribosyltransferase
MLENLLALVRGRQGHFLLESGHHGDVWFELETLCLHAREAQTFAAELARRLLKHKVEVVCGPLVEGAFIALMVSLEMGCEFVYAERFANAREGLYPVEYRVPEALRDVVRGRRMAIVNDFISAGSAVLGTYRDLETKGARVVAIGALVSLGETIGAFGVKQQVAIELLERMPNHLWTPTECPLCAAGQALEIVGTS